MVERRLISCDNQIEDDVEKTIRPADKLGWFPAKTVERCVDGLQRLVMKRDEKIFPEKKIQLGRGEMRGMRVVDRVHYEVEVIVVVLEFRERTVRDAVLDRERVKGENLFQDEFDFLFRRVREVHPHHHARLAAKRGERFDRWDRRYEFRVAIDEQVDHRRRRLSVFRSGTVEPRMNTDGRGSANETTDR